MLRRTVVAAGLLLAGCAGEPASTSILECGSSIGTEPPPADFQVVLGVVGLPAAPGHTALQVGPSGGAPRLFAKTGLVVRATAPVELIAPADRFGIGWGGQAPAAQRFVVPGCPAPAGAQWLEYAGGYWIDEPACVRVLVRAGGREQQVEIGLGAPCPGQQPPAQP